MQEHFMPIVAVVAAWWLGTAVVLRLVWLPHRSHQRSLFAGAIVAALGVLGVLWSSEQTTVAAAYVGFASSLAVWGWHELTFLLGVIAGPRRVPCRPEARGWSRFRDATATVIHHELALALTVAGFVAMTWGSPNQVATGTFAVLWLMRLSAKLNVFAGVRNLADEFIPPHLAYLTSYFRRVRFSLGVLVSVLAAGVLLVPLVQGAISADDSFRTVGYTLVSTLLALAVVEHVFLAVPLPDALLWRWVIRHGPGRSVPDDTTDSELSFPLGRGARARG